MAKREIGEYQLKHLHSCGCSMLAMPLKLDTLIGIWTYKYKLLLALTSGSISASYLNLVYIPAVILTEFQIKDLGNAFVMLPRYLDIRNYFVLGLCLSLLCHATPICPLPVSTSFWACSITSCKY
ncbi:hypothetical protein AAZV13_04G095200 [Glycine max]